MDKTDCNKINQNINKKLNRVKGQLNGIEKMIEERRDSIEVVTQIQAVRAALSSIALDLLKDECSECFNQKSNEIKQKQFEELITKFFKIN